jgi:hypothetical protein
MRWSAASSARQARRSLQDYVSGKRLIVEGEERLERLFGGLVAMEQRILHQRRLGCKVDIRTTQIIRRLD